MARLPVIGALCSILLCGCFGGDVSGSAAGDGIASGEGTASSASPGKPVEKGGPLTQLQPCAEPPDSVEGEVEGLVLPPDSVITKVDDQGQLIRVDAYVEQTPIAVRMFYNAADDLEILEIEDEVFEAEVLFGAGDFRSYAKAMAICDQASTMIVFVGPGDSGDLPSLGGG